jgi:hypothetical protein
VAHAQLTCDAGQLAVALALTLRRFARLESPERTDGWPRGCFFLDEFGEQVMESVREWRANGDPVPHPVYPERGGLLLWGHIGGGGYAFWLTEPAQEPEGWPMVIASQIGEVWRKFDGPVCDFLTEVAAARFDTTGFTTGPVNVVGDRKTASPIVLSARPVFEPDAPPPPPPPVVAPEPRVPDSGFWASRQQRFRHPPVSEMAVLREHLGAPPAKVRPVDWGQVRSRLGMGLPADYREFIDTYGPGRLGDLRIMAPGAPDDWDLFALLQRKYGQVRYLERNSAGDPPFHPEPGGTISWGETADGWTCCWAPGEADPDAWNVVVLYPTPNLRGYSLIGGVSFSSALKRYILGEWDPVRRDPSAAPVSFTPCRRALQAVVPRELFRDPVPLEYSIVWLTCVFASRLDVVLVSLPGAAQDRLRSGGTGGRRGRREYEPTRSARRALSVGWDSWTGNVPPSAATSTMRSLQSLKVTKRRPAARRHQGRKPRAEAHPQVGPAHATRSRCRTGLTAARAP